jgi:serine phosphatase RsbU (regulator of sigma subunit)
VTAPTGVLDPPTVRLLLVEDDEGDAFLVRELLDESGAAIEVEWVRSLSEAKAAAASGPHCVLLDLGLPDAEGVDALRQVLQALPQAAVLVLTGLSDEHRAVEAVGAGAQDYLVKGQVDGPLLARSIRYALERRRADEELRRLQAAELRAAENARLERGLLPQAQVVDPRIRVVSRYQPGRDAVLGGDFFDVVESCDGVLHALVGDVCGHGPDEAALGVALRIAWRALVLSGLEQDRVLPVLEDLLVRERRSEEVFATVCTLAVAPDRRSAVLRLAGHPSPLLLADRPEQLPDELVGPALGVLPGAVVWGSLALPLRPPWRLGLFSDGLVEGHGPLPGERLGVEGLLELVRRSQCYADSGALTDEVIAAARRLHGEELPDDVAVLVLECAAP